MTVAEAKIAARRAALARRAAAAAKGDPAAGAARLTEVLSGHRSLPLAGYMPMRGEIDPLPAMAAHAARAPLGVPVIEGRGMPLSFHLWTPEAEMQDGPFGARIPRMAQPIIPRVLVVPMVAFDRGGNRLGYGGGYYDRTLARLRAGGPVLAIGFAWAAQEANALPLEPTDQPLDMIVTEVETLRFG